MTQSASRMAMALSTAALLFLTRSRGDEPLSATDIRKYFDVYCVSCHGEEKPKADFTITPKRLTGEFKDPVMAGRWKEIARVLGSHEMPPRKAKQPPAVETSKAIDWITRQIVQAEEASRSRTVTLRRLNREEYRNTIRDLVGVDFDVSGFPQDPPAGGFDNNGGALSFSPLQAELYLSAARQILDRALVDGEKPPVVKWRFLPKAGPADRTRMRLDAKNNPIVNGGNNRQQGRFVAVHVDSWDKAVGTRDFKVSHPGMYAIRVSAAGMVPDRNSVVESAGKILESRRDEQNARQPNRARQNQEQMDRDLEHFRTDPMYDYGPARARLVLQLGPQPRTLAEFDATGTAEKPLVHEFMARFTTEHAGINFQYDYAIPKVLENFWMQRRDEFARPELLVEWFEIEGPIHESWPPASHSGILVDSPLKAAQGAEYATEVIGRFMRKAYRRPVGKDEVEAKVGRFKAARSSGASFIESIRQALASVLVSPHFLFLAEAGSLPGEPLSPHEIASRMSYFIWSSIPDAELEAAADSGSLAKPGERIRQARRMLRDPKCHAFVRNFAGQWLGLREVGSNPPAPDLYPQYDRHLETSMVGESEAFFREILANDLDAMKLVKSDFVMVNERLARFYGINTNSAPASAGVRGDHFRKVAVPHGIHRGGVVTQASILCVTSNGTRTSPVRRGTWILKNLLGMDPGLPVANVGDIAPKVPGVDKATVRQRLEVHRSMEQCARCHNRIDPLGFALENYNAAGEWREREGFGYKGRVQKNDPLIDARSEMIDGTPIDGVRGLQQALLDRSDLFLTCLANKMFTYALGRETGLSDQPLVRQAVARMNKDGNTLRSLIEAIVTSPAFGSH
ncbi:MAG: DUF1592 domain-containing protein [Planctomycetes bacterium]|nr:DUF1592 domain-containing protein [Planctomycetota bacterium]